MENLRILFLDNNMGVETERKKAFIERESARFWSLEESRVRITTEISQREQQLDKQKNEVEKLCKTMAADPEGPYMVVDSNGLGTAKSQLVLFAGTPSDAGHFHQMYNPDPVPISSRACSKHSEKTCTTSAARRKPSSRKRKGNAPKVDKSERERLGTPSAVPHKSLGISHVWQRVRERQRCGM